eukprot:1705817-Rhodomonas_salina.1
MKDVEGIDVDTTGGAEKELDFSSSGPPPISWSEDGQLRLFGIDATAEVSSSSSASSSSSLSSLPLSLPFLCLFLSSPSLFLSLFLSPSPSPSPSLFPPYPISLACTQPSHTQTSSIQVWAIALVYFVQGITGISRLAVSYYYKDSLHIGPAEMALVGSIQILPSAPPPRALVLLLFMVCFLFA